MPRCCFLIAIAKHVLWTGDQQIFQALRSNVDRALAWLDRKTDESAAGYVTYDGLAEGGQPVPNQSWRDSGTGVLRSDGSYPRPPLALVEVQGYAFQARRLISAVLRRAGEHGPADTLDTAADELQDRFLREFWMEDEGCYCLGLEQDGPADHLRVTSNAAQVLWTGIATPAHGQGDSGTDHSGPTCSPAGGFAPYRRIMPPLTRSPTSKAACGPSTTR